MPLLRFLPYFVARVVDAGRGSLRDEGENLRRRADEGELSRVGDGRPVRIRVRVCVCVCVCVALGCVALGCVGLSWFWVGLGWFGLAEVRAGGRVGCRGEDVFFQER